MKRINRVAALLVVGIGFLPTLSFSQEKAEASSQPGMYRKAEAGWLERSGYRSVATGKLRVQFSDVLVGPGREAVVKEMPNGALLDVQGGLAAVLVDGKEERAAPGRVFSINQGQMLRIDNSKGTRAFVARLTYISVAR